MRHRVMTVTIPLIILLAAISILTRLPPMAANAAENLTPVAFVYLPYAYVSKPLAATATPTPSPTSTATNTPTPSPTSTATNTPTPSPTSTATNTPTPPIHDVSILPNHTHYVDNIDYLHVVGEVQNNTSNHLRFVRITANFYNDGQLLDTNFSYARLSSLPPGEKTCFHILLPRPTNWTNYQFEQPTYYTDAEPLPNLTILSHSGSYNGTFGWYEIVGEIRNDQGERVEFVKSVGTLYNASNQVIGCDIAYVNSTDLDPGQTSSFKHLFTGRDYADTSTYRLQADGTLPTAMMQD